MSDVFTPKKINVKADFYFFFNTKLLAKHFRRNMKLFNAIHLTIVVQKSRKRTDAEKRQAYEWMIENLPDEPIKDVWLNIPYFSFWGDYKSRYTEEEIRTHIHVIRGWSGIHQYLREMLSTEGDFPPEDRVSITEEYEHTIPTPFAITQFVQDVFSGKVYMIARDNGVYQVFCDGSKSKRLSSFFFEENDFSLLNCQYYGGEEDYVYRPLNFISN